MVTLGKALQQYHERIQYGSVAHYIRIGGDTKDQWVRQGCALEPPHLRDKEAQQQTGAPHGDDRMHTFHDFIWFHNVYANVEKLEC